MENIAGQKKTGYGESENKGPERWSEEEHNTLMNIVKKREELEATDETQEKLSGTIKMWNLVSAQLEEHGYFRSSHGCRSHWKRSVDEKLDIKGEDDARQVPMGHSIFAPQRRKRHIIVESDSESELSLPAKKLCPTTSAPIGNSEDSFDQPQMVTHQQYGSMAPGQIDKFDNKIQELTSTKALLTKEIANLEVTLATLRNVKDAKQQELDGVKRKIIANEDGKKALQRLRDALGNPDIE